MEAETSSQEHLKLAGRHAENREWASASLHFGQAAAAEPSAPILVQYGHSLKEAGYLDAAVNAYRYAMEWDGTDTDAPLHLGHLLKRLGRFDDAMEVFDTLTRIPHAPYIRSEIEGLRIGKLNRHLFCASPEQANEVAVELPEELLHTHRKLDTLMVEERCRRSELMRVKASKAARCLTGMVSATLPIRLQPLANLVIQNDILYATTPNPQMKIEFVEQGSLKDIGASWIEFRVRIRAQGRPVEPVLFIQHQPGWGQFSSVRLRSNGNDVFSAILHVSEPVLMIRLDPIKSAGPIYLSETLLNRLSLYSVLSRVRRQVGGLAMAKIATAAGPGWRKRVNASLEDIFRPSAVNPYDRWMLKYERQKNALPPARQADESLSLGWLLPAGGADIARIRSTLQSFTQQEGDIGWALLVLADDRTPKAVRDFLHLEAVGNHRLTIRTMPGNLGTGEILSLGSAFMSTDYIAHIEPGDRLSPDALLHFAAILVDNPAARLVYCDHDVIDANMQRHSAHFKPDWNFLYSLCFDYVGRTVVFSAKAMAQAGGYCGVYDSGQDFHLLLRVAIGAQDHEIMHIPLPLWHCYTPASAKNIVAPVTNIAQTHGLGFAVEPGALIGTTRLVWPLPETLPHVTLIIPTRDRIDLLKCAVESILSRTSYPAFDIVIVDNGSVEAESLEYFVEISAAGRVSILRDDGAFNFSRLNNRAAALAGGSVLALVNNDVEAIEENWLSELVSTALDPRVGAVGAKLIYGSGHVQHAGIVGGVGAVAGHGHKYFTRDAPGYMNRLVVQQSAIAVTAACLVVEKKKFDAVGGFDEENLRVAFNDVDLCLKLAERGWQTVFTPWAVLHHHESISRGLDIGGESATRFKKEAAFMMDKWGETLLRDRYYSPNLTRQHEDFSLRL